MEYIEKSQKATSLIAAKEQSSFLSLLPSVDVEMTETGLAVYETNESLIPNFPIAIRKHDDQIIITPMDSELEDPMEELAEVFGDDDSNTSIEGPKEYAFDEATLVAVFSEEPEYVPDLIAILETKQREDQDITTGHVVVNFTSEDMLDLLKALKDEGFSLVDIINKFDANTTDTVVDFIRFYRDSYRGALRRRFEELDGPLYTEEDNFDDDD